MKYEVEAKARVENIEKIIQILKEKDCVLSEPIIQDDYIYVPKGIQYDEIHKYPVLRLRKQGGKNLFTLKKNRSNELDCLEKEFEVGDGPALLDVFELLGYSKLAEVHKKRQKGRMGEYEICVDEVQNPGSFVEVEKMTEEEDGLVFKTKLLNLWKVLEFQKKIE